MNAVNGFALNSRRTPSRGIPLVPIRMKTWKSAVILALLLALPWAVTDRYILHLVIHAGVFVILASSWNLLAGYAGLVNLGHAAFFGIGAYTSALAAMHLGITPWATLFLGAGAAAFFGLLLGFPSLRLSGPYLAITTIGFSEILRLVAMNWVDVTRGSLGLYGIPALTRLVLPGDVTIAFVREKNIYYVLLVLVLASLWAMRRLVRSEFGLSLKAMRDDETGALSIGVDTARYKLCAFTVSAFFAGLAGAFHAHYARLITPDLLALPETFAVLTMTMFGGLGTLAGPVVGVILLTGVSESLRFVQDALNLDVRLIIYGMLLIVTILFMRGGVVGLWRSRRAARGADAETAEEARG